MPLIKTERLSDSKIWGIWNITETLQEMFSILNLNIEDDGYTALRHPNKKMEWAGSRLLTHALCKEMNWPYPGISKDEFGKPFLNDWSLGISVSHKFPYVIVMLDKYEDVGIDIEQQNDKILKIGKKFMNETELSWAKNVFEVTIVWGAKEALYKLHGRKKLLFKEQLFVELLEGNEEKGILSGEIVDGTPVQYELVYQVEKDGMVVVYSL